MATNHCLDIKLFNDHALVTRPGSTLAKPIGIKDLMSVLSESAQGVLNYSRSEKLRLPSNTYLTEYAGNKLNLCLYFPEHPTKLKHIRETKPIEYEIMMPNIVVHLVLNVSNNAGKHQVEQVFYYSTPLGREDLPSAIPGRLRGIFSHIPFPNCYENFTLCFGANQMFNSVEGGDLRIFNAYYHVLESSPFNDDLSLRSVEFSGTHRQWFQKMAEVYKNEQRFPYELIRY